MREKPDVQSSPNTNKNQIEFLSSKLFREGENKKKLAFILQNTDISETVIIEAQKISNNNPYHNFGHQLWVAESAIRIAHAMWLSKQESNLLALVGLFHDACHTGISKPDDEEIAYQNMMNIVSEEELVNLWCTKDDVYKLIIATKFSLRGKCTWVLEKIIQDADMWCIGYGPYYILYSTMWLVDEEHSSIDNYIKEEANFFSCLEKIDPQIYLSDGAKMIFSDPRESLKQIAEWPQEVITYAYTQRYQDISFEDFSRSIADIIYR